MSGTERDAELLAAVDEIEKILHNRAERRPEPGEEEAYVRLRRLLVGDDEVQARLPKLILSSSNLSAVWGFLREHLKWQDRRELVSRGLEPVRAWLEGRPEVGGFGDEPSLPDSRTLLHTIRALLDSEGHLAAANLVMGASATFGVRKHDGTLQLRVPIDRIKAFGTSERGQILEAARRVLPPGLTWYLAGINVDPLLETPPDEDDPLPGPTWKPDRVIEHEGLWFRSKTEIRIYEALRKQSVFFFVNSTGVLGGKSSTSGRAALREPDFLVCLNGKWGILEVMGEHFHTSQAAPKDHDRARLFKEYGIRMIEFYDAHRCYQSPEEVVGEFLRLLARS